MLPLRHDQDPGDCAQYVHPNSHTQHQCTVHVKMDKRADIYWIIVVDRTFDQPDGLELTFRRPLDRLSLRLTNVVVHRGRCAHCRV